MSTRSILLHLARQREKDHQVHETVVSIAVETIFREAALLISHTAMAMTRKVNRASRGPRALTKEGRRQGRWEIQRKIQRFQECQRLYKGKSSKIGLSAFENSKLEKSLETQESAQTYPTDNSYTDNSWCDDGWSYDEWNDEWSLVGRHEGWRNPLCQFSRLSLSCKFCSRCSEQSKAVRRVKMNLDRNYSGHIFH